jgi:hypothetical protein
LDQIGLRKRWAWEARRARHAQLQSAKGATERWRALGKRGTYRVPSKAFAKSTRRPSSVFVGGIAVLSLLLMTLGLYVAGAVLLFEHPYHAGAQSFREQYFAATGRQAPRRHLSAWKLAGQPLAKADDTAITAARAQLGRYPFVELSSKDAEAGEKRLCGWLVQASGGQVLMLTADGLVMKNFGDGAFGWTTESPDRCMVSSAGTKN